MTAVLAATVVAFLTSFLIASIMGRLIGRASDVDAPTVDSWPVHQLSDTSDAELDAARGRLLSMLEHPSALRTRRRN